ncbi:MAG: hypothetical protein J3Q66DRAFT_404949 [Benniella sp.]|nr:MAG: hypothetical protein J3Q66DRAFT_404949 [Benniella sp.]
MLAFSEYAAADKHEHATFEKQYACFVQYVGRLRSRGNRSASQDILNLEKCRKDYDTMQLKESSGLVRKLSKSIIDSGLQAYTKDLLEEVTGGNGSCSADAAPKDEQAKKTVNHRVQADSEDEAVTRSTPKVPPKTANKKRARDDDHNEKISRPRHNQGRRSSITLPDEGTLVDTSKLQVYRYMFGKANIGRLFKGFQVASAPTVNTFDIRVTLANLPNFLSINYIWDTSVALSGLSVNVHKEIRDRFVWPISPMPHAHTLRTSLENQLRNEDEIFINGDTVELRAIQSLYHNFSLKLPLESHTFEKSVEDTFCHGAIDTLFTHFFPRRGVYDLEWANKEASGSKERRYNGYKPDAIVSRDGCEIFFLEVKPPEESAIRHYLSDQWKLANLCKDTITSFVGQGRAITKAAGIQIFGYKVSLYTMEYVGGIYHWSRSCICYLPCDVNDGSRIFGCLELFQTLKDFLDTIATDKVMQTPPLIEYDDDEGTVLDEGRPSKITPSTRGNMF